MSYDAAVQNLRRQFEALPADASAGSKFTEAQKAKWFKKLGEWVQGGGNLVLTDGARADSVPNLEIETGEIAGAGHASATGRFDDEQLFYLQARGIPEDQARRLVVRGFFGELISKIAVPAVRERLTDAIEHELAITESRTATS